MRQDYVCGSTRNYYQSIYFHKYLLQYPCAHSPDPEYKPYLLWASGLELGIRSYGQKCKTKVSDSDIPQIISAFMRFGAPMPFQLFHVGSPHHNALPELLTLRTEPAASAASLEEEVYSENPRP